MAVTFRTRDGELLVPVEMVGGSSVCELNMAVTFRTRDGELLVPVEMVGGSSV
jgi:hypothetical protein